MNLNQKNLNSQLQNLSKRIEFQRFHWKQSLDLRSLSKKLICKSLVRAFIILVTLHLKLTFCKIYENTLYTLREHFV